DLLEVKLMVTSMLLNLESDTTASGPASPIIAAVGIRTMLPHAKRMKFALEPVDAITTLTFIFLGQLIVTASKMSYWIRLKLIYDSSKVQFPGRQWLGRHKNPCLGESMASTACALFMKLKLLISSLILAATLLLGLAVGQVHLVKAGVTKVVSAALARINGS